MSTETIMAGTLGQTLRGFTPLFLVLGSNMHMAPCSSLMLVSTLFRLLCTLLASKISMLSCNVFCLCVCVCVWWFCSCVVSFLCTCLCWCLCFCACVWCVCWMCMPLFLCALMFLLSCLMCSFYVYVFVFVYTLMAFMCRFIFLLFACVHGHIRTRLQYWSYTHSCTYIAVALIV